jgi:hypothetical protein
MNNSSAKATRLYLTSMGLFWLVFGLITTFYPKLMDLFQTEEGINAKTAFSNHVWSHDGLDIISLCILLFALSRENVSRNIVRAVAFAALMPTIGITYSLITTPYWNNLFIGSALGCFAFAVWGFVLAGKMNVVAQVEERAIA